MKEKQYNNKFSDKIFRKIYLLILILLIGPASMYAQKITVSGVVTDEKGESVIGAGILQKGTGNGTITDFNGNFKIDVPANALLQISYISYATRDIPVEGKTFLRITLQEESTALDEVVVVGYGAQKKESVVGSISQMTARDLMRTPTGNISQALSGKLPGVVTSQTSGAPGIDDAEIFIRGRASFAGDNQPLILVDGVERPFSQIAPDDIESISILKDASATAVYGVRGANGVMLITTKRGENQKPVVSLTANWQMQSPTRSDTYLDSYQSVMLLEEALANDGLTSQYSAADIEMYKKAGMGQLTGIDALLYPNVNWYDEVLNKTAPAQRYNVNIQGGTKRLRYFTSAEYYNQEGLLKNFSTDAYGNESNSSYQRYSFRANLDFLLSRDLTLGINFGTRFEERKGPNTNDYSAGFSEVFYELNHTPGWIFPVNYTIEEDGIRQTLYGGNSQNQNNIVGRLAKAGHYRETKTINEINFKVDYKLDWITPGLSARGMVAFDYDSFYRRLFEAGFAVYELVDRNNHNSIYGYNQFTMDTELTYAGNNQETRMKVYMEYQLNYARKFDVHDVTAMLLYNQNDYRFQADLPRRYQGLVGRATYGFDNRYLGEVNFGYNGSENFVQGRRFGFFPSFSLGWRINNEQFMEKTTDWLENLKLRVSYGEVGNDVYKINGIQQRFLYESIWTQISNAYTFGNSASKSGIYESQYANYYVTWERAQKYNAGLDFSLMRGLISGSFDYFTESRKDILTRYETVSQLLGVNLAAGNLGTTENKGFELELKHFNKIGKDLSYNVGFSFAHARNKIINMDEPAGKTSYRKREGHPIDQFFGYIVEGFVTEADLAATGENALPISSFGDIKAGDLKYHDMNKDGFIDERDETFIGYSDIPENTYSLTLGADWKGIGFNLMFQGVDNVSRYYDAEAMYAFVNGGKVKEHHLKRWNPGLSEIENLANAEYPLLHYDNYGNHNQQQNSFFLKNGAFIRLKNVELSYTVPEKLSNQWKMSQLRFYVNGNNLITWDKLDELTDPENRGSNRYPIMKTVNFGVNVKF